MDATTSETTDDTSATTMTATTGVATETSTTPSSAGTADATTSETTDDTSATTMTATTGVATETSTTPSSAGTANTVAEETSTNTSQGTDQCRNYVGCFGKPGLRNKSWPPFIENLNIENCKRACQEMKSQKGEMRFAGLRNGTKCVCGAGVWELLVADSNCNEPCRGNAEEMCGGENFFSIYLVQNFVPHNQ
ncbi:uncharacterized protein LOC141902787 [Tubulanus polymorphus]|uniref:uncharacterized protein LOC141902787 n=1 Tax=Tubulanus polymorphus TaxID=672921 RepID=UPI003DA22A25